ncbi:hypothetical protein CALCODRAFT_519329 [Calocera cornea HHB12733]|uniref:Uncharacterized protein n=1 Tax=Calocera cornea HHB12733 TaxID=1353952 RepID=A0A165EBR6_9BASI|nr:hypothetical protein CALCODRAFT_519329 [Calocera cornea HHB12733]
MNATCQNPPHPAARQHWHSVSHAQLIAFFQHHLGLSSADISSPGPEPRRSVPFVYHTPVARDKAYDPSRFHTARLLLALAPSPELYDRLSPSSAAPRPPASASSRKRRTATAIFLHRPWGLDRKRLPRGTLALAEHEAYDERLTVGWNAALVRGLLGALPGLEPGQDLDRDLDVGEKRGKAQDQDQDQDQDRDERDWISLRGYKTSPSRRIGLLAPLAKSTSTMQALSQRIQLEFGGCEACELNGSPGRRCSVLACLNAFSEEVARRVERVVRERGWDRGEGAAGGMGGVLCLTGAAKEAGMRVARELGMGVVAVGHRRCEMWGLQYLARRASEEFGERLEVVDLDAVDE